MSWYTDPPAHYVILRLGEKSPASSLSNLRPSDVKNQLVGTRVGILKPFNEVIYHSGTNQKDIYFAVVEVSIGNRNTGIVASSQNAVISRMTQVFFLNSDHNGVYCFSPDPREWCLESPYSTDDSTIALSLHDPSTVRAIIGENILYSAELSSQLIPPNKQVIS